MSIVDIKVPPVGESVTEVSILQWRKQPGQAVALDETLCELESDKATLELPAEQAGVLVEILVAEGDTVAIGGVIARLDTAAVATAPVASEAPVSAPPVTPTAVSADSHATGHPSPAAAKILAEKAIPATAVTGTGVGGRITKEDALHAVPPQLDPLPAVLQSPAQLFPVAAAETPATGRETKRQKMTQLRKTIARRLVAVKNETAMLTTFNEVDMQPLMDLRKKYKDRFKEKHGVGLGYMSFFTAAVCMALEEFPSVNAQIDGDEMIFANYCDISIAVSTPKGLVVPVVRNAETLSLAEIEAEIGRLAAKARDGKLSIEEMSGGTFTITNGGVFGSMLSTPIINAPQAAILGMHNIVERPVARNGQVVIRPIMYVALSYDHRLIDGRESVSFLVRIKELLEDPARLLLKV
jgi:2-oxoglutarate dehydrogenase E2 component (dihydrolipoamide succinyltransferase)